ncbi:hypothetical protein OOZ15_00240 [Galbibacter sp. EGI 63066]|uniref:beta strand repeat-containing protein n=1 Tax=Galbibacter sp. EGI 63066 TaxID=2993559 RepID=UPI002248C308|nr:hypothetical protein [Galbibacter sp. EGI 63066]MCX2678358.1 hypothetical protein [Galbibacter sp. EGI 63066]
MKRILLLLIFNFCVYGLYSQVGIGTPMPDNSTQLDVVASDKGILIPRVALTSSADATTIVNENINSLLVFNTATVADISPGYYYWYEDKWLRIINSEDAGGGNLPDNVMVFNPITNEFTYIDENGNTQVVTTEEIVQSNETLTPLIGNADGIYTYTDEEGTKTIVDIPASVKENIQNGGDIYNEILNTITTNSDALVDNGDGTFTHTAADGTVVTFDANTTTVTDNGDGTYTVTNADGTTITVDTNADTSTYDNTGSGLTATNVQDALDEIAATAGIISPLVDNGDGTVTYTDEDGVATTVDFATMIDTFETLTTIVDNGDGTFTYTDEDGNPTTIDIANLETLTTLVDNGDGTVTYTDEDGVATTVDFATMIDMFETLTTIVDNGDGTFTYTDEDGNPTIIDVANLETLTSMVQDDATGVITYTDEDAVTSTAEVVSADADNLVQVGTDGGSFIDATALTEPWFDQATDTEATQNTQNIYQTGNVAVQKIDNYAGTALDVEGAVRGGTNQAGTVGVNSVAFGDGNTASGVNAAAFGTGNIASGDNSVAMGAGQGTDIVGNLLNNEAAGAYSMVMGQGNTLWGTGSAVFGNGNQIGTALNEGNWSLVAGLRNEANTSRTFILGMDNTVNQHPMGLFDVYIFGVRNIVNGANSYLIGKDLETTGASQMAIGQYNAIRTSGDPRPPGEVPALTEPVFQVGVGRNTVSYENAMTILYNSHTGIGIAGTEAAASPTEMLDIGSEGVRIRDINTAPYAGDTATDNVVVADANGVLKTVAVGDVGNTSTVTQVVTTGNTVATHDDGTGTTTDILETITTLVDNTDGTFTYTNEDNTPVTFDANADLRLMNPGGLLTISHITEDAGVGSNGTDAGGNRNILIGTNTGQSHDGTANDNIAIGHNAGSSNVSSNFSVAIGTGALQANTATYNTAVGFSALNDNIDGSQNTAIGGLTMRFGTTGIGSTAIGMRAMDNHIGNDNVAVGRNVLRAGTNFNNSTAVGAAALYELNTGERNTALGHNAGRFITTGNDNVFLGQSAGSTMTSGDNNIFVGQSVQPNVSLTGSNQLNIGNWIYGDNGLIGIGTAAAVPTERLDVSNGNVRIRDINTNTGASTDNVVVADATGVLKTVAVGDVGNTSTVTQVVTTGNTLATHDDGTGATTDILETVTTLGIATGELTYANEDGSNANVALISADANNGITAGTDGALFMDVAAEETNTTLGIAAGELTYANEDADNANVNLISTDANNNITAGTDGALYVDVSAEETVTTLGIAAGELAYANEDGTNANVALISTDANNGITAGTDGALFMDVAAEETNTTLGIAAGELTYANEDADNANVNLISTDADNDITAGTDDALFVDVSAEETVTTLGIAAGELAYANEDGTNANVALISTDANNGITAGTDGALFADVSALEPWFGADDNLAATDNTEDIYHFGYVGIGTEAPDRALLIENDNINDSKDDIMIRTYSGASNVTPSINLRRAAGTAATPTDLVAGNTIGALSFTAHSNGGFGAFHQTGLRATYRGDGTTGETELELRTSDTGQMFIYEDGNINFTQYPNTRDDSGTTAVDNLLYTDALGNVLSAPAASVVAEPWFDQANIGSPATANTQDIYQMGMVGIGTDDMLGTANPDVVLAINGSMLTTSSIYADYVFEDYFEGASKLNVNYSFKSLKEIEQFINENHHLPGITKIDALAKNEKGDYVINPSELSVQVLEKVEELYLHTIEQQKLLEAKDKKIQGLETRLERLEKLLLGDKN